MFVLENDETKVYDTNQYEILSTYILDNTFLNNTFHCHSLVAPPDLAKRPLNN